MKDVVTKPHVLPPTSGHAGLNRDVVTAKQSCTAADLHDVQACMTQTLLGILGCGSINPRLGKTDSTVTPQTSEG